MDIYAMQEHDYASVTDLTGFDPARLQADRADQHFAVLDAENSVQARCSIWWRGVAELAEQRSGAIGHYAANCSRASRILLEHACRQLRIRGCETAIGPLDGCTWRNYRCVTDRGTAPQFFLEPDNEDHCPRQFVGSGFVELAHYVSEFNPDIRRCQPGLGRAREKMDSLGVSVEPLVSGDWNSELRGIHDVVCESFRNGFLYSPLDYTSFCEMYLPLLRKLDPRLMLVARHAGRIVGFIFGPPDMLQAPPVDTIVIKTVAILPEERYRGLGRLLIVELLRNAASMGYEKSISALMHCANNSQAISSEFATPMRRYTLYKRDLAA